MARRIAASPTALQAHTVRPAARVPASGSSPSSTASFPAAANEPSCCASLCSSGSNAASATAARQATTIPPRITAPRTAWSRSQRCTRTVPSRSGSSAPNNPVPIVVAGSVPRSRQTWPPVTAARDQCSPTVSSGGASSSARQASIACQDTGTATGSAAGVAFNSGWPDSGSACAPASRPTGPAELFLSVQWIGRNKVPGACSGACSATTTSAPCGVSTRTSAPSAMSRSSASVGAILSTGSTACAARRGTRPVRLMVCHWSRSRPVLSSMGNRSLCSAASPRGVTATKRARPSGVENPPFPNSRPSSASAGLPVGGGDRPALRRHGLVARRVQVPERAQVEAARAVVLERRQPRVLAEDGRRAVPAERVAVPEPAAELAEHPPVRPRLARRVAETPLPRQAAFRVGHRAVLLAPPGRGQHHVGERRGVGVPAIRHHHQRAAAQRLAYGIRPGHGRGRVGGGDPDRLDAAVRHRLEQVHRLQPRTARQARRVPEPSHTVQRVRLEAHVRCELVGQAPHLAPAHGVGLAGDGERPGAGSADPPGGEMAVQDGVDLVRAGGGLVHPLRVHRDHPVGRGEQVEELPDPFFRKPGRRRHRPDVAAARRARRRQRRLEPGGVAGHVVPVARIPVCQEAEQAVEQHSVAARAQRQVQGRRVGRGGAPGIDHHDPRVPPGQPGVQHRVAPGAVGAHQHHELGRVPVVVDARHHVLAKGAHVPGHGGRHAQPRVGVDVGRADEALHQLVGDVVVLGEELSRQVERHAVGAMGLDRAAEPGRHPVQRLVPAGLPAVHARPQQPPAPAQRFAQRGALGTQPALIGRMRLVAHHPPVRQRHHPASHPAIRAGGADAAGPRGQALLLQAQAPTGTPAAAPFQSCRRQRRPASSRPSSAAPARAAKPRNAGP